MIVNRDDIIENNNNRTNVGYHYCTLVFCFAFRYMLARVKRLLHPSALQPYVLVTNMRRARTK